VLVPVDSGEGQAHPDAPLEDTLRATTVGRTIATAVLVAALVVPTVASAQVPSSRGLEQQLEQELEKAAGEREHLASELDSRRGQLEGAEEELAAVGARVVDARGRLRAAEGQLALAEAAEAEAEEARVLAVRDHERTEAALARTETELEHEEGRLAQQAVSAYKFGSAGARAGSMAFDVMRRAEDPNELAVGMKQLSNVIDSQGDIIAEVMELRDERRELRAEAQLARGVAAQAAADAAAQVRFTQQLREDAEALATELAAQEAEQAELVEQLRAETDQVEAALERVSARAAELSRELTERRRAAEAAAAAARGSSATSGSGGGPDISDGVCPVVGAVAGRDFSNDWGYPRSGGRTHQGNDIFADAGTPIVAVQDGVVIRANRNDTGLGGLSVTYRTADGSEWYNAHLETVVAGIEPGVAVARGQIVGTVGNTGNARTTPPHNHFGRKFDGTWVNPWPTISPLCG
jgi:murein DD-endopeptidase MepM/ murein hydrolase activator NlpD